VAFAFAWVRREGHSATQENCQIDLVVCASHLD
jgi:hypothetical protein